MYFEGFFFSGNGVGISPFEDEQWRKETNDGTPLSISVFFFLPCPYSKSWSFWKRPDFPEEIEKNPENFSIITFRRRGSLSFWKWKPYFLLGLPFFVHVFGVSRISIRAPRCQERVTSTRTLDEWMGSISWRWKWVLKKKQMCWLVGLVVGCILYSMPFWVLEFFLFRFNWCVLIWMGFFEDQISGSLKITDPLDLRARAAVLWLCRRGHFHPMNSWWKKTELCRSLPGKP